MRRIKLTVAYDGTDYCGWQIQPNGITIEEVLNSALSPPYRAESNCYRSQQDGCRCPCTGKCCGAGHRVSDPSGEIRACGESVTAGGYRGGEVGRGPGRLAPAIPGFCQDVRIPYSESGDAGSAQTKRYLACLLPS